MYKKYKMGVNIFISASLLFMVENFYFGWNETPQNALEKAVDNTVVFMWIVGLTLILIPGVTFYRRMVIRLDLEEELRKEAERTTKAEIDNDTANMCYCEKCVERRAKQVAEKELNKDG